MQNRRGDKGSPWQMPLLQLKKPTEWPLTEKEIFADSRMIFTQLLNLALKPKELRTRRMNSQSMASNAFSISILIAKLPPKDLLSKRSIASDVMQTQSLICPLDETSLIFRDNFGSNQSQTISHYLSNNFELKISQCNGTVIFNGICPRKLGIETTRLTLRLGRSQPWRKN